VTGGWKNPNGGRRRSFGFSASLARRLAVPENQCFHPDEPIWGCDAIARTAGLFKPDGSVDTRKGYYLIERGMIDATKVRGGDGRGELLVSTRRRVLRSLGILVGEDNALDSANHLSRSVGGTSKADRG
jgi:hypothetical protein